MPLQTQPQDFDYQRDIAPSLSRFFGEIRRDPRLSPQSVERLQSTVLRDSNEIEAQRMKLQEERDQSLLRNLSARQTMLHLDEFRRRQREEERQAEEASQAAASIRATVGTDEPDAIKRAKLRDLTLSSLGTAVTNPNVARMLDLANGAFPQDKDPFTPAQYVQMGMEGVPPEVLATGDPLVIGQYAGAVAEQRRRRTLLEKQMMDKAEKDESYQLRILDAPIKFARPAEGADPAAPKSLDEESAVNARIVVLKWGTPEEKAEFDASKDDVLRAKIANDVRIRQITRRVNGTEDKVSKVRQRVGL